RPGGAAVAPAERAADARFGQSVALRRRVPRDAQLVLEQAREAVGHEGAADDLNRQFLRADDALRAAVELPDAIRNLRQHVAERAVLPGRSFRTDARQNQNRNQNQNPEPRTPNAEPLQACTHVWAPRIAKIAAGFKLDPISTARATKAEALATAKLTPFRLRSREIPGMSRGYADASRTARPSISASE